MIKKISQKNAPFKMCASIMTMSAFMLGTSMASTTYASNDELLEAETENHHSSYIKIAKSWPDSTILREHYFMNTCCPIYEDLIYIIDWGKGLATFKGSQIHDLFPKKFELRGILNDTDVLYPTLDKPLENLKKNYFLKVAGKDSGELKGDELIQFIMDHYRIVTNNKIVFLLTSSEKLEKSN